jgi:L-threonylcarbamoyladenylate synthase
MERDVLDAVSELRGGGVVVLPTETVYGLAANALSHDAVKKIFEIKGRPFNDPLILHIPNEEWLDRYTYHEECSGRVKKIANKFWPGSVTIVLHKKPVIPDIVTAGLDTVAVRCPRHEIFQSVLRAADFPLAAPSANPFGYVSPTSADQVKETLGHRVKMIIDGGKCDIGVESTIVDLTQKTPKILRPGAVTAAEIAAILKENVDDYHPTVTGTPNAPGQLKQHYCTNTRLKLFDHGFRDFSGSFDGRTAMIFCQKLNNLENFAEKFGILVKNIFWLSENGDPNAIARHLFATLQTLDRGNYDLILCERPTRTGIGIAVDDRLLRASAKFENEYGE